MYLLAMENNNIEKVTFMYMIFSIVTKPGKQRFQKHMCTVKHHLQMLLMRVRVCQNHLQGDHNYALLVSILQN